MKQFPFREETKYFGFRYKQNPDHVMAIAHFADGFIKTVNRDFFNAASD